MPIDPAGTFVAAYVGARTAGRPVASLVRADAQVQRPDAGVIGGRDAVAAEEARIAALGCRPELNVVLVRDAHTVFVEEAVVCPLSPTDPYLGARTSALLRYVLDDAGLVAAARTWLSLVPYGGPTGAPPVELRVDGADAERRVVVIRDLHARDHVPAAKLDEDGWATATHVVTVGDRWALTGGLWHDLAEVAEVGDRPLVRRTYVDHGLRWQPWSGAPRP